MCSVPYSCLCVSVFLSMYHVSLVFFIVMWRMIVFIQLILRLLSGLEPYSPMIQCFYQSSYLCLFSVYLVWILSRYLFIAMHMHSFNGSWWEEFFSHPYDLTGVRQVNVWLVFLLPGYTWNLGNSHEMNQSWWYLRWLILCVNVSGPQGAQIFWCVCGGGFGWH